MYINIIKNNIGDNSTIGIYIVEWVVNFSNGSSIGNKKSYNRFDSLLDLNNQVVTIYIITTISKNIINA